MPICPCGSKKDYSQCCQSIHQNPQNAIVPEQLMRARYSAHVLKLVDFIVQTYHPDCQAENQRKEIAESAKLNWIGLEVLASAQSDQNENEGFVEFSARLLDGDKIETMHERSRFLREDGQWYYVDGTFIPAGKPVRIKRNDPCPCGSGKKFKKCCG